MDRREFDRKRKLIPSAGTTPYVESYDEAVDVHLERDLQVWEKLRAFNERFLVRAWAHALPDKDGKIDSGH
jgi:hypothetical protein